jgi:hypothetical protein
MVLGQSASHIVFRNIALALILSLQTLTVFAEGYRDQWHPTALEIMKLPQYCHGQFIHELKGKPGYGIYNCGGYMNHFCPGLILINRASDLAKPKAQRREFLREARAEINYTKNFLPKNCPLEPDIRVADMRLRGLEMGVK